MSATMTTTPPGSLSLVLLILHCTDGFYCSMWHVGGGGGVGEEEVWAVGVRVLWVG